MLLFRKIKVKRYLNKEEGHIEGTEKRLVLYYLEINENK